MTEKLDPNKVNFLYREFHDVPELNEKLSIFPHEISRFAYNALQLQRIQAFIDEENESDKMWKVRELWFHWQMYG